jgi:hypothetical protein
MYDSDTPSVIPADARAVAGYVNGYAAAAWAEAGGFARFPKARQLRIDVNGSRPDANVLDVETGDATPDQAPGWIKACQAHGTVVPTIYCSQSAMPRIMSLCAGLHYQIWSAHYTGKPAIDAGAVATQYADPNAGSGGHWDVSLIGPSFTWPI